MKKLIIILIALAVVAGGAYAVFGLPVAAGSSDDTPAAEAIPAVKASNEVVADGAVVPARSAQLSMATGGVVAEVLVAEGDRVEAGQVLVRLESANQTAAVAVAEAGLARAEAALAELVAGPRPQEVAAASAAVDVARAQLAKVEQGTQPEQVTAAEAALARAQATLQKVQEGPGEEELVAARAEVANAEAQLAQAQAAYDRVKWAADIAARPEALQLEQATNTYEAACARLNALQEGPSAADVASAQAQVAEAQAQLDAVRAPARSADIAAAQAEVERAMAQLELLEAGARPETIAGAQAEVAAAQASLDQAEAALAQTELRAPFAGVVASLTVKAGEHVAPGVPLAWLANLSSWQIETDDLTEINVVRIRPGDPATITFDALPDLSLPGHVARIKELGENKMGDITYTAVVEPERHEEALRWNMTASVTIEPR